MVADGLAMVIVVSPLQPLKAELPMLVTDSGIDIDDNLVQLENAPLSMLVTDSGITIEVMPLQ